MIKKGTLGICLLFLVAVLSLSVFSDASLPRLADEAGLLTEAEATALRGKLDEISTRQNVDIVVITVPSLGETTDGSAADARYDTGYGLGGDRSCILLLVCMETRSWHVTTAGVGIAAIDHAGTDRLSEAFLPRLSEGNYAAAFTDFAEYCDEQITAAAKAEEFNPILSLAISLVIGFIIASIAVSRMKSKLYTVHAQYGAAGYVVKDSLHLRQRDDLFLYKTVTREKKEEKKETQNTHKTDNGSTVGGTGGTF